MQTGHELFVHGLNDMMDAERQLVQALEENANDSSRRPDLQKAFEQHRKETEGQVERLEQCFELLSEQPEETDCHGIRGLVAEKKSFTEEDPSEDLIDVYDIANRGEEERRAGHQRNANSDRDERPSASQPYFLTCR